MSDVVTVTDQLPPVAKSIFIECKNCKQERYHRVLAHTSEKTAKLECEVCKKKRSFTLKLPKAKKATRAKSPGEGMTKAQQSSFWQEMSSKMESQPAQDYNMRGSFEKDAKIKHPTFGIGFVVLSSGHRLEIAFEDQVRALAQRMN
jgi:hypothetical protein